MSAGPGHPPRQAAEPGDGDRSAGWGGRSAVGGPGRAAQPPPAALGERRGAAAAVGLAAAAGGGPWKRSKTTARRAVKDFSAATRAARTGPVMHGAGSASNGNLRPHRRRFAGAI